MHHNHSWTHFFFGTPRRALITVVVIAVLVLTGLAGTIIRAVEREIIIPLIIIAILLAILRYALFGNKGGHK